MYLFISVWLRFFVVIKEAIVACLAASSANLFPKIPTWLGGQRIFIFGYRFFLNFLLMSGNMRRCRYFLLTLRKKVSKCRFFLSLFDLFQWLLI